MSSAGIMRLLTQTADKKSALGTAWSQIWPGANYHWAIVACPQMYPCSP